MKKQTSATKLALLYLKFASSTGEYLKLVEYLKRNPEDLSAFEELQRLQKRQSITYFVEVLRQIETRLGTRVEEMNIKKRFGDLFEVVSFLKKLSRLPPWEEIILLRGKKIIEIESLQKEVDPLTKVSYIATVRRSDQEDFLLSEIKFLIRSLTLYHVSSDMRKFKF